MFEDKTKADSTTETLPGGAAASSATAPGDPKTIAERVALGIVTSSITLGAIVPFPEGWSPESIQQHLRGKTLKNVSRLTQGGYKLTAFGYRDDQGRLLQVLLRFDHPTMPKEIRPLRYVGNVKHAADPCYMTWIEGIKPLYGLDRLANRPEAPVLVVEGEKTAEAAQRLFADHVAITWASGANAVKNAEMLALCGRDITIWPDNDDAGRRAGRMFAALAHQAGAASIRVVTVPDTFPEKWDLADDVPAAVTSPALMDQLLADASAYAFEPNDLGTPGGKKRRTPPPFFFNIPGKSKVDRGYIQERLKDDLDADMNGRKWRDIGRCLYLAYGPFGLPTFNEWSQTGKEKYRKGECEQMWRDFANEKVFLAKPVAWLIRQADKEREKRGKPPVDPNVETDCTPDEISDAESDDGLESIASDIPDDDHAEDRRVAAVEELNASYAVVSRGGKTVVIYQRFDGEKGRYEFEYLGKSDFVNKFVRKVWVKDDKGKAKLKPLGEYWFGSSLRRQFNNITFKPGRTADYGELNLWTGFAVEPSDNPEGWSKFKDHLFENVAGGDQIAFDYIINWMAFGVQQLDKPTGVALILQGQKGSGKSFVTNHYGYLFGGHKFVTSIGDDIVGKFNSHLEMTLLFGVEEAFAPQNRSADGVLKDLITRPELRVEAKFAGIWTAKNHLRIIMTSNNDQVVRADGYERRYAVFEVTNPHQHDVIKRGKMFGEIELQLENGGYESMLGELLDRDISGWNPESIPATKALTDQKTLNLCNDPIMAWYRSRLEDGIYVLPGRENARCCEWSQTNEVWVPVSHAVADFQAYCKENGFRGNEVQFRSKLARFMPEGFVSKARRFDGVGGTMPAKAYPFPPLPEAKRIFTEKTGVTFQSEEPSSNL